MSDHPSAASPQSGGKAHEKPQEQPNRVRIDKDNYPVDAALQTGRQLLLLAGRTPPEQYQIFRKMRGGELVEIGLEEQVDIGAPGIERFVTLPLDQTEGEAPALRRAFPLPSGDTAFLDVLGLYWETVRCGGLGRLVIHDYAVAPGYNVETVRLNLIIEPAYPDTQIDMVYVYPALVRPDRRPIPATTTDSFDGLVWQRWSRHRTGANPWRPGVDDVSTHLALVNHWFERELERKV